MSGSSSRKKLKTKTKGKTKIEEIPKNGRETSNIVIYD